MNHLTSKWKCCLLDQAEVFVRSMGSKNHQSASAHVRARLKLLYNPLRAPHVAASKPSKSTPTQRSDWSTCALPACLLDPGYACCTWNAQSNGSGWAGEALSRTVGTSTRRRDCRGSFTYATALRSRSSELQMVTFPVWTYRCAFLLASLQQYLRKVWFELGDADNKSPA